MQGELDRLSTAFAGEASKPLPRKAARRLLEIVAVHLVAAFCEWQRENPVASYNATAPPPQAGGEAGSITCFVRDCVAVSSGEIVGAREMYVAYKTYCAVNARDAVSETRFGLTLKHCLKKNNPKAHRRAYLDVVLRDALAPADLQRARRPMRAGQRASHRATRGMSRHD
jgi:hypothetical protein